MIQNYLNKTILIFKSRLMGLKVFKEYQKAISEDLFMNWIKKI